ncbi:hypothetical protein D9M68_793530 [compost metagenome]
MVLTDSEHQPLAKLATYRVAQAVLDEGLAEEHIGGIGKELLFKVFGDKALLLLPVLASRRHHRIALLREQLGGDVSPRINDHWVNQEALLHAIQQ